MLDVDVIPQEMVGSSYSVSIDCKTLLGVHWRQRHNQAHRLAQLSRLHDTGLQVALVTDSPSEDQVPLQLMEVADRVRYWSAEHQQWYYCKDRCGKRGLR